MAALIGLPVFCLILGTNPRLAVGIVDFFVRNAWHAGGNFIPTPGDTAESAAIWLPVKILRISPSALPPLIEALDDESLKPRTKVMCAEIALSLKPSSYQREHITASLMRLVTEKRFLYRGAILLLLKMQPADSSEDAALQRFLIGLLDTESDDELRGFLMYRLSQLRSTAAVPVIEKLLGSGASRAYLTLGRIGGPQGFEALQRSLSNESDPQLVDQILMAMGATKDHRAKAALLSQLGKSQERSVYVGTLKGLSCLGDPGTLPALERELLAPGRDDVRFLIKRTIESVKRGGEKFEY